MKEAKDSSQVVLEDIAYPIFLALIEFLYTDGTSDPPTHSLFSLCYPPTTSHTTPLANHSIQTTHPPTHPPTRPPPRSRHCGPGGFLPAFSSRRSFWGGTPEKDVRA